MVKILSLTFTDDVYDFTNKMLMYTKYKKWIRQFLYIYIINDEDDRTNITIVYGGSVFTVPPTRLVIEEDNFQQTD